MGIGVSRFLLLIEMVYPLSVHYICPPLVFRTCHKPVLFKAVTSDVYLFLAAQRRLEFWIGHYADPVYLTGDYPQCMKSQLGSRLPPFTAEESALLKGSSDFYGMNTYTSDYIKEKHTSPEEGDYLGNVEVTKIGSDGKELGPQAESFWLQDGIPPPPIPGNPSPILLWSLFCLSVQMAEV
jgi:hypothetical protein